MEDKVLHKWEEINGKYELIRTNKDIMIIECDGDCVLYGRSAFEFARVVEENQRLERLVESLTTDVD